MRHTHPPLNIVNVRTTNYLLVYLEKIRQSLRGTYLELYFDVI